MSLDVYLYAPGHGARPQPSSGPHIFIRENGATREVTREEFRARWPDREPVTTWIEGDREEEVYSRNITHNLGRMAKEAGIYEACWRPEEIGVTKAAQLIPLLRAGLDLLRKEPARFVPLNPPNGWGDHEGLVAFVADYLAACEANPDAEVEVSR